MSFNGRFEMDGIEEILAKRDLETGGAVQRHIDSAVIRYSEPYTPFDTGDLARSPNAATDIGSGEVKYPGPYARYQYYGNVMGPNIPIKQGGEVVGFFSPPNQEKHLTGAKLQYSTEVNPLAGSFWFERATADHKKDILEEASKIAGSKHD